MVINYVPQQGDIIFLELGPTKGHEQSGRRPAIVVSNNIFNLYTKMAVVCPISSNLKNFPTHYILNETKKISGAVLCEHVRSIDYKSRNIVFIEKASDNDFLSVLMLMNSCF